MCGRYTNALTWRQIVELYRLTSPTAAAAPNLEPRFNIAPTTTIWIVTPADGGRQLVQARWGLVPSWWKKPLKDLPSTFNARAETVAEKPMFRSAFKARRCIVPASGWFEWTGDRKARLPWYITHPEGEPLSFAGLYERYTDPETGETAISASIIVCAANDALSHIHDRMPVVMAPEDVDRWLNEPDPGLLVPAPDDALTAWRVSPAVNSNRYQSSDAIVPIQVVGEEQVARKPT